MIEFLNAETHTPVLLMKHLWSPHRREVRIWVSTVFILKSRKTEIARSVRGPESQEPRAEDPLAESYFVQKILVITAHHKDLSEGGESRNNHRYAVVVQDLATQWIQSYPCKKKLPRKHKGACKSSWSRMGNLKSFTLSIPWNSAKLVKIFPGIIVRRHHTDREHMGLLREQYAEWKKVRLQYCCNHFWMKNGGQVPWNAILICETFKISCLMGRLHTNDVLGNHLEDQSFRLVHWLSITLFLRKTSQESINLERKSYLDCSLDTLCVNSTPHTLPFLSVCARHLRTLRSLFDPLFALFICLSRLLPLHPPELRLLPFPLPCGCCRSKIPCALRPMRILALWPITPLSHVMSPTSSTTTTTQRPLKFSSKNPPATRGRRTCMTRRSVTTPSAERSSPVFTEEREEPVGLGQAYHPLEESLLPSQSLSVGHVRTGRMVSDEFGSLISNVMENPRRD